MAPLVLRVQFIPQQGWLWKKNVSQKYAMLGS